MIRSLILLAALLVSAPMHAGPSAPPAAQDIEMSEGVVRKVDAAAGKLTLRHGPIVNLDMPPMTMVFRVQTPALLQNLKAGDRVRFRAEQIEGVFTVVELRPQP